MVNLSIFQQNFFSQRNVITLYDVIRESTRQKFGITINDHFRQKVLPEVMDHVWSSFGQPIFNQNISFNDKLLMINKEVCRESSEYIGAKLPPPRNEEMQPRNEPPRNEPPRPRPSQQVPSNPATLEEQLADRNRMYQPQQCVQPPQLPSEENADTPISDDEMDRRMQELLQMRRSDREAQIQKPDDDAEIIPEVEQQQPMQPRIEREPQSQDFRDMARKLAQKHLADRTISAPSVVPQTHHHIVPQPQQPQPRNEPPQQQKPENMILRVVYGPYGQQLFTRTPSGHITPIITAKQQSTILSKVASNMKIDYVLIREFRATNTGWNIHCRNNIVTLKESPSAEPITIVITPGTYDCKESFIEATNSAIREQYGEMIQIVDLPDGSDNATISLSSSIESFASELLSDISISGFSKFFETEDDLETERNQYVSFMGDKMRIPLRRELYAGAYSTSSFKICQHIWQEDDGTIRLIWNGPWNFEKGMDMRLFHSDGTLCTECPNHMNIVFDIHWHA